MPSPNLRNPLGALFVKEFREILASRAFWVMLLMLCPLVGYGFIQAVKLYGEASRTALQFPELARGMTPLDGIAVPTWGAFYLALTLLFPFVTIRLMGNEKQSGSLKLLLQLPVSPSRIVAMKVLALAVAWGIMAVPPVSALLLWLHMGGHAHAPEILNLIAGYGLYSMVIAGIALFAATLTDSAATAAIVALAFTLGSWVLDFASNTQSGWLKSIASLSLTASLRVFERGLFASPEALRLIITFLCLSCLAVVWLPPGMRLAAKLRRSAGVIILAAVALALSTAFPFYRDMTEERRNSFNPADERALKQMSQPLRITIHLDREDSRLKEMEQGVLAKLRRMVPGLSVTYEGSGRTGLFAGEGDAGYGMIYYEYAGKRDASRSNSEEEILPLLHGLAGNKVTPDPVREYPGYPLVADTSLSELWFYGLLPALLAGAWWFGRKIPKRVHLLK